MIFISIAQKETELAALESAVEFATLLRPKVDDKKGDWEHKKLLLSPRLDEPRSNFAEIATEFSRWVGKDDVTVLVSQVHPMKLNPLQNEGLESLLAMLILAFPEVRWFFCTIRGYKKMSGNASNGEKAKITDVTEALDNFRSGCGLRNLFQPEQLSLFDGVGLRNWVRRCALDDKNTRADVLYLPRRGSLAIALDEETDYAHLHAYTAYRFGFCALPISRRAAADVVLGKHPDPAWETPKVVLEDIFLNFPDGGRRLSNLVTRNDVFPQLEKAEHRILVTSGQRVPGDAEKQAENKFYIAKQKANGKNIRLLHKPHAGIFSVWEQSRLHRQLSWSGDNGPGKTHRGVGDGYVWPPDWREIEREQQEKGSTDGSGHSSPGILLLIACSLLERAKSMLGAGLSSVEYAVRGAVLANDALELLGGKTPTTAAEALSLKHQFELHAECQFSGVEFHIPLHSRLGEIKRDATSIARWFGPNKGREACLNIQMTTVNHLIRILRNYNQYDEEQICMSRARHLHNTLWMRQRLYRLILLPLLRYLEWLLSSFAAFVTALVLWVMVLSWLFVWTTHYETLWPAGISDAISSFFSIGGPIPHPPIQLTDSCKSDGPGWEQVAVVCTAIVSGFIHLGVFISHLYSIVSRK